MESAKTSPRRLTPACLALALCAAAVAGLGGWFAFGPYGHERAAVSVAGAHTALGECLASRLRDGRLLAQAPQKSPPRPEVTLLADGAAGTTRVIYEGRVNLRFIVTLTATRDGASEARLTTFPTLDPGPAVTRAVRDCAAR